MPGGNRGTFLEAALALNTEEHTLKDMKCWVDHGYYFEDVSLTTYAGAKAICEHKGKLSKLFQYAVKNNAVREKDY